MWVQNNIRLSPWTSGEWTYGQTIRVRLLSTSHSTSKCGDCLSPLNLRSYESRKFYPKFSLPIGHTPTYVQAFGYITFVWLAHAISAFRVFPLLVLFNVSPNSFSPIPTLLGESNLTPLSIVVVPGCQKSRLSRLYRPGLPCHNMGDFNYGHPSLIN